MRSADDKSSRGHRWRTFSLRGLLVLVTVLCIWLGIETERARSQARGIRRVEKLGGRVAFDYEWVNGGINPDAQPWAPRWLRRIVGDDYFRQVHTVNFYGSQVANDDLAILRDLRGATRLAFYRHPTVNDKGLSHLTALPRLEELWLQGTPVRGPGLEHVGDLRILSLEGTPVTDEGLKHLKCPKLKGLSVAGTDISDDGVQELVRRHTELRGLDLSDTAITDRGLSHLPALKSLQVLILENLSISDAGLRHLQRLPSLKYVRISFSEATPLGVAKLQQRLPRCEIHDYGHAHWFGGFDRGFAGFEQE